MTADHVSKILRIRTFDHGSPLAFCVVNGPTTASSASSFQLPTCPPFDQLLLSVTIFQPNGDDAHQNRNGDLVHLHHIAYADHLATLQGQQRRLEQQYQAQHTRIIQQTIAFYERRCHKLERLNASLQFKVDKLSSQLQSTVDKLSQHVLAGWETEKE